MQKVFKDKTFVGSSPACDWNELVGVAHAFEQLDEPHRWTTGCPLASRASLQMISRQRTLIQKG